MFNDISKAPNESAPNQENRTASTLNWWLLLIIGIGSLMAALDGSVVNTILPVLRDFFNCNVTSIQWISLIYLLVLSSLLLAFGRLGDIHGHKKIYISGFLVFIIASALCGISWSLPILVFFRALQAIGGAMMASNSPALITGSFPQQQRGRAFGLVSTMTYLGLTLGPSLGGWLTDLINWRVVFFINVPIGILGLILGVFVIPPDESLKVRQPFDFFGSGIFILGLSSMILWINQISVLGWESLIIKVLIIVSFLSLMLFIRIEKKVQYPMLDIKIFRVTLFTNSVLNSLLNYICIFSITFLLPFYLIQGRNLSAAEAGLLLTIQPIIMAVTAPISGSLSDRLGARIPGMVGMFGLAIGLFLLSKIGPETSLIYISLALAITGFGTGTFISPNTSALMGSAPQSQQGIASGIQAASRNIGMVFGIGLAGAIFSSNITKDPVSGFYKGIDIGFFVSSCLAILGFLISAAKEK